ncbi:uncharacterized protein LOC135806791 [Sycon ciliatum]|uniref:uncharacterized protein LOC135806791 n=1 Tax=Sycon ciliatum TaxID=27933 RepID=UPI0031F62DA4
MFRGVHILAANLKMQKLNSPLFSLLVIYAFSSCPACESKNLPEYYGREYFVSSDDDPNPSLATVPQVEQLQVAVQALIQQVSNLSAVLSARDDGLSAQLNAVSAMASVLESQQTNLSERLSLLEGPGPNVSARLDNLEGQQQQQGERLSILERTQANETVRLSSLENTVAGQLINVSSKLNTAAENVKILEEAASSASNGLQILQGNMSALSEQMKTTTVLISNLESSQVNLTNQVERAKTTYTHWGRQACNSSLTLYSGIMAGPFFSTIGGGSDYQCLPFEPEYSAFVPGSQGNRLHSSEFQTDFSELPNFQALYQHTPACSVCETSAQLMLPARLSCPDGWTVNYRGYLMSSIHHRTEYICMDSDPQAVPNTQENVNGAIIYFVETGDTTDIPSSYDTNKEVTCTVCTK